MYESRRGEVFLLGRVVVADRGHHARPRGRLPGARRARQDALLERRQARPPDRARARDRRVHARAARHQREPRRAKLQADLGLDERAARNLVAYLDDQVEATGAVPDDRTVVVERFRDELGDWRVCVLSPFGQRVHAPWGLAIEQRLLDRFGPGAQVLWGDDGIVVRLPEAVDRIPVEDLVFDPDEIEDAVVAALPGTAMFASVFREASARALLLPRQRPGKRTPLWQQRQRSADLLVEAAKHPTFPMLLETTRECLRDVFDVPALREVMADLRSRRTKLVAVDTETRRRSRSRCCSAGSRSSCTRATRRSPSGGPPRSPSIATCCASCSAPRSSASCSTRARSTRSSSSCSGSPTAGTPGPPTARPTCCGTSGPLREDEVAARVDGDVPAWLARLVDEGRAIRVQVGGEDRLAAVEDAAALRDALGVSLPIGLPGVFTEPSERPLERLVARYARTHGPFAIHEAAARLGAGEDRVRAALESLASEGRVVHGGFRPGGVEREWFDVDVLRRIRQRSLAALRKEVEPVDAATLRAVPARVAGRRPAAWRRRRAGRRDRSAPGSRGPRLDPRDRRAARPRARLPPRRPRRAVRERRRGLGRRRVPRVRRRARHARLPRRARPARSDLGRSPRRRAPRRDPRAPRGAWCVVLARPRAGGGHRDERVLLGALWDLVWAGEVTNDTLAPLRAFVRGASSKVRASRPGHRPRPGALRRAGPPAGAGRWSLVAPLREPSPSPTELAHARALQLLDRHGVVTREAVLAENAPGGFAGVYPVLKAMEEAGKVRRGYFVAGLGAAQFAMPGAVDRLRSSADVRWGGMGTERKAHRS